MKQPSPHFITYMKIYNEYACHIFVSIEANMRPVFLLRLIDTHIA